MRFYSRGTRIKRSQTTSIPSYWCRYGVIEQQNEYGHPNKHHIYNIIRNEVRVFAFDSESDV